MKEYWKLDRVKNITPEYIIEYIDFLSAKDGELYSDLNAYADIFYNKSQGSQYYGRIVTTINSCGLYRKNEDGTFNISNLSKLILDNNDLAKDFLDFYLLRYQFPRPQLKDTDSFSKPALSIIKLLLELYRINPNEAYLTRVEFFHLFNEGISILDISDIDNTLAAKIINSNRAWGLALNLPNGTHDLTYEKAFFNNSVVLSTNEKIYNVAGRDFFIGLSNKQENIEFARFLVNHYSSQIFTYPLTGRSADDIIKNKWSDYTNNIEDFNKYLIYRHMIRDIKPFEEFCLAKGFYFKEDLIRRFLMSLSAKSYLLLTGISGTGKSKIAELYGEYLKENEKGDINVKAVGSNWNDNKHLLGYWNPIVCDGTYSSTDVVEFIRQANADPTKIYILLLDEMNLSYTERYFADFLSALESRNHAITLPDKTPNVDKIIYWSENLKVIGTINEDETTHTLSPKVLDRSNVIEMNGSNPSEYYEMLEAKGDAKVQEFVTKRWKGNYLSKLDEIHTALKGGFGYRTMDEILRYVILNTDLLQTAPTDKDYEFYLDEQIYQKILPKINGSRGVIQEKLHKLNTVIPVDMSLTKEKIKGMTEQLSLTGFTSFINS